MARGSYRIDRFRGIDQSRDENALEPGMSPDACNMDTTDGNLTVAKGFERAIDAPVPGTGAIHRLLLFRKASGDQILVMAGNQIYAWKDGAWSSIYAYPSIANGRFDAVQAQIGSADYIVIGCGEHQLVKYDGSTASAFGSADKNSDINVLHLALYRGRLFSAGDPEHPSRLYWSKLPGDARSIEDWSYDAASPNVEGGHTEVGDTGSDPIIALRALSNQVLIFKKYSVFRLIGDRPSNYTIERIEAVTGNLAHTSLVHYGDVAYYMTDAGMFIFNGVTVGLSADARCIRNILKAATTKNSRAALAKDKYYCSLATPRGDALVEYDMYERTYMLRRGFEISDVCAWDDQLYLINSNRYVYRFNRGDSYDGEKIEAYWQTPLTDLYEKSEIKALRELYLRGESDSNQSAMLVDARIGLTTGTYRMLLPDEETQVLEIPLKNEGRAFSLRFYNEAGGHFSIKGGVELVYEQRRRTE